MIDGAQLAPLIRRKQLCALRNELAGLRSILDAYAKSNATLDENELGFFARAVSALEDRLYPRVDEQDVEDAFVGEARRCEIVPKARAEGAARLRDVGCLVDEGRAYLRWAMRSDSMLAELLVILADADECLTEALRIEGREPRAVHGKQKRGGA